MTFRDGLADVSRIQFLYATTPPRASSPEDRIQAAIDRLVERTSSLKLDAVVVYDVQDERHRTEEERPFPFLPTLPSQAYASRLRDVLTAPPITYKCVAGMSEEAWRNWIDDAGREQLAFVSVVGQASSRKEHEGVSLPQALRMAAHSPAPPTLGGVVIPERHSAARSESERLRRKSELGCQYFISQAIYDADGVIRLIRDYAQDCERHGETPKRLFLTFTPCGYERTLTFMKWLGIHIPDETAHRILSSSTPITESIDICLANFRRIIDATHKIAVPIGVNVESISIRKDEIVGSIELHRQLSEIGG
jgi:hypothetical protein